MADNPNPDAPDKDADDKKDDKPTPTPDELGDAGKKALDAERKARKEAERQLAEVAARLKEIDDQDKSDNEKLTERLTTAEKLAADAEVRAMRAEVAHSKGLTPGQAKRLAGTTVEELEADADELIETFGAVDGDRPAPTNRPIPSGTVPRGGGDPTVGVDETDPRKLAEAIVLGQGM